MKGTATSITICGKRVGLGDWVRVHHSKGRQGWIEGEIIELWCPCLDGHHQARVSSGWCFHDNDEIEEHRLNSTEGNTVTQGAAVSHTPGPWKVSGLRAEQDGCLSIVSAKTGFDVAELAYTNGPEVADARLIAAAPALLEALQELTDAVADNVALGALLLKVAKASSAIALATPNKDGTP